MTLISLLVFSFPKLILLLHFGQGPSFSEYKSDYTTFIKHTSVFAFALRIKKNIPHMAGQGKYDHTLLPSLFYSYTQRVIFCFMSSRYTNFHYAHLQFQSPHWPWAKQSPSAQFCPHPSFVNPYFSFLFQSSVFPGESSLTSLTESLALIEYYERMPSPLFGKFSQFLISYMFDRLFD